MNLHLPTLVLLMGIACVIQVIAIFVQYRLNSTYSGIGWWLTGSMLMALGYIFMDMLLFPKLLMLAMIGNPLVELGRICLYIGIVQFLGQKINKRVISLVFIIYICFYYYFMFFNASFYSRTVAISAIISIISGMTAYNLFFKRDRFLAGAANFTAVVFLADACFCVLRILLLPWAPAFHSYFNQDPMYLLTFMVPYVASALWTFGFIIMVNQRLTNENREEKEKMQLIFNTGPDVALITRMLDGLFVDVNVGFLAISGYTRAEVIGKSMLEVNIWHDINNRQHFITELKKSGFCENMDFIFQCKDGSYFDGIISAKSININGQPHIISIIRDITERKRAEQKIHELVKQLEIEKNTAQHNAITDSLTQLPNRRHFDEVLSREFNRLHRSLAPLSLIMLDVDNFKKFNDSYGHLAGDDCLRKIGAALKSTVGRAADVVARYGGEEFVVILPETDNDGAAVLAEQIRMAVEKLAIPHLESKISEYVTISLGVVTVDTTKLQSPEQVVVLADEALYLAKQGGRNQSVVVADGVV